MFWHPVVPTRRFVYGMYPRELLQQYSRDILNQLERWPLARMERCWPLPLTIALSAYGRRNSVNCVAPILVFLHCAKKLQIMSNIELTLILAGKIALRI